jgi:hypothetical protein
MGGACRGARTRAALVAVAAAPSRRAGARARVTASAAAVGVRRAPWSPGDASRVRARGV